MRCEVSCLINGHVSPAMSLSLALPLQFLSAAALLNDLGRLRITYGRAWVSITLD